MKHDLKIRQDAVVHAIVLPMRVLLLATSFLACAGCGMPRDYVNIEDGNAKYFNFQHAFTEAAANSTHARAEKYCARVKLVAVKTRSTCTMTECSTDYQCMNSEEAARLAPPEIKKK